MAKKINVSAIKEFMFNHGEKVALGTCAFLALLFGSLGLLRALTAGKAESGKPWADEFKQTRMAISSAMDGAAVKELPPEKAAKFKEDAYDWKYIGWPFDPSPYNSFPADSTTKRLNPIALAIKGGKDIQLDYIRGLVWVHKVEGNILKGVEAAAGGGGGGGNMQPGIDKFKGGGVGQPPGAGAQQQQATQVLKEAQPIRAVVVTAQFPMKLQVEEFQRALKMLSQDELFKQPREDLPRPLGITVVRFEIVNGKPVDKDGEVLVGINPRTGRFEKSRALDNLLRIAIYDEKTPEALEPFIWEGLNTPIPRLANVRWPRFEFKGFDIAWDEEGEMKKQEMAVGGGGGPPPKGGSGGVTLPGGSKMKKGMPAVGMDNNPGAQAAVELKQVSIKSQDLKKSNLALYNRLFDKDHDYNIYHVLGFYPPPKEAAAAVGAGKGFGVPQGNTSKDQGRYFAAWDIDPPQGGAVPGDGNVPAGGVGGAPPRPTGGGSGVPPAAGGGGKPPMGSSGGMPPMGGGGGGVEGGAGAANWERDALVRFIDPDVVPGKTYQYVVNVRLANPNFKKTTEVAYGSLAEIRELVSNWVETPTITIPAESYFFAVDQHLVDEMAAGNQPKKTPTKDPYQLAKDQTTFQIHQWTQTARKENTVLMIGDWAVAERVAVRRGESIGFQAFVQVPAWKAEKDSFEVPLIRDPTVKDPKRAGMKPGLLMDFKLDSERPVLVDFAGGKRYKGTTTTVDEETAVEALILSPDGKLTVKNSRADADYEEVDPVDRTTVISRQDRVLSARRRVDEVLRRGSGEPGPNKGDGPKLPGGPPPKQ
jgi:hypothetical protein